MIEMLLLLLTALFVFLVTFDKVFGSIIDLNSLYGLSLAVLEEALFEMSYKQKKLLWEMAYPECLKQTNPLNTELVRRIFRKLPEPLLTNYFMEYPPKDFSEWTWLLNLCVSKKKVDYDELAFKYSRILENVLFDSPKSFKKICTLKILIFDEKVGKIYEKCYRNYLSKTLAKMAYKRNQVLSVASILWAMMIADRLEAFKTHKELSLVFPECVPLEVALTKSKDSPTHWLALKISHNRWKDISKFDEKVSCFAILQALEGACFDGNVFARLCSLTSSKHHEYIAGVLCPESKLYKCLLGKFSKLLEEGVVGAFLDCPKCLLGIIRGYYFP